MHKPTLHTIAICLAGVLSAPSHADEMKALSMFGEAAFPAGIEAPYPWTDPAAGRGCSLRLGAIGTFDSMNPFIVKGLPAPGLHNVYQRLMARSDDEPFTLYPQIARSVEMAEDRSWIVFHLDPAARFSDGRPITAEDVLFSLDILREKGKPHTRTYYSAVSRAEALDPLTVRMELEGANWEMPLIMGLMTVVSKAYFERVPFDETSLEAPVGSGPYRIVEIDPGHRLVYERDPDYWAREQPISRHRYNFDTIEYVWFRDSGVALEAFKAGDLDVRLEGSASRWATAYEGPGLESGEIVRAEIGHGRPSGLRAVAWNQRRPPFDDVRVREALGLAFDFAWTNRTLLHGQYRRTQSLFDNSELAPRGAAEGGELALLEPFRERLPAALFERPFAWPGTEDSGALRRNLRRATELLREAGFELRDGRLIDPRTEAPFSFEILINSSAWERIMLPYAENLAKLGVEARVRVADSAQFYQRIKTFDFDAMLWRWGVSLSPGNEQLIYWSSAAASDEGSRNYPGIEDPTIDALIEALVNARTRQGLVDATRALDRVLMWGRHVLPLYYKGHDNWAYWTTRVARPARATLYVSDLSSWHCGAR